MSPSAILVTGIALVLALPLAQRLRRRRFDPFEPIVLFAVAYGVMFVARPTVMLAKGDLAYGGVGLRETLPAALLLALVGAVAFLVGYELRPGVAAARRLPAPRPIQSRSVIRLAVGLALIALAALIAMTTGLGVGSRDLGSAAVRSDYFMYAARLIVPAALCVLALAVRERSPRLTGAAALLVAASLALLVPVGSRIFLLPLLGGVLVFAYVHRGKRPSAAFLLVLAVVGLFASYAAVVAREPERRANVRAEFTQLAQRPYRVFDLILYRGDAEMAPALAGALTVVPKELGYRYGRATVGEAFVRPIPRAIWPGKPKTPGEQVVDEVWPQFAPHFHPAFSPLLPLYWDFGIAGVIAGMALFGIACRTLYVWFMRHARSFAAQLIFSVAVWYVVIGARNEPVDTLALAAFVVLPLILLERLSGRRAPGVRPFLARMRRAAPSP